MFSGGVKKSWTDRKIRVPDNSDAATLNLITSMLPDNLRKITAWAANNTSDIKYTLDCALNIYCFKTKQKGGKKNRGEVSFFLGKFCFLDFTSASFLVASCWCDHMTSYDSWWHERGFVRNICDRSFCHNCTFRRFFRSPQNFCNSPLG